MARAPEWKIYDSNGNYEAATKSPETAAAVVALLGTGATIRNGHAFVVWREGLESQPADESYDFVADTCFRRVEEYHQQLRERREARNAAAVALAEKGFK